MAEFLTYHREKNPGRFVISALLMAYGAVGFLMIARSDRTANGGCAP